MFAGQLFFAINDIIVKYTVKLSNNDYSTLNIIFIRGIFTSLLIFFIILIFTKTEIKKIFSDKRTYLRGLFEALTALFFFAGLILMPVSIVYTLLMTAPLIVTLYASLFTNEKVGLRRWSAVIIGFIGVLIVINPINTEIGIIFLLPIIAAIFLTLRDVVTKGFVNKNNFLEITLITALMVMVGSGIFSMFIEIDINLAYLKYIFISSLFLTLGYVCSVLTIFYAPLSLTAASRYSVIVFGIIFGFLILGEVPNKNMLYGALIISISGLFVIKRQKDLGKIK
jgi:drug/metabolite transporter (DMT)-like permease